VHIHRDVMIRWRVLKTWRTCAFAFGFSEQLLCLSSTQIDLRPPFRPQLTLKLKGPYRSKRESTLDASVLPLRSQTKVPRQCDGGAMLVSAFAPQRPRLRESTSTTNAPSLATSQFVGASSRCLLCPKYHDISEKGIKLELAFSLIFPICLDNSFLTSWLIFHHPIFLGSCEVHKNEPHYHCPPWLPPLHQKVQ